MRFKNNYVPGFYELNAFPGCNQIVISNHSWIGKEHRGKGFGGMEHRSRLAHIEGLGYDYAMCTVKAENIPQIRILEKEGWKMLDGFTNRETGHIVFIFGRKM